VVKASGNCFVNSKLPRPQETNPPDARIDFARQLKATRIARGFAYARHFAAALGLEENRYTRYERAEVEPSLSIIRRMCATLGVTPNDLLAPSEGAEPSASAAIGRQENLAWRLASELATVRAIPTQPQGVTRSLPALHATAALFRRLTEDPYRTVADITSTEVMASIEDHRKETIVHLIQAYIDSVRRLDC
jgi:transcriptional regulator with XRE-family HTH domain